MEIYSIFVFSVDIDRHKIINYCKVHMQNRSSKKTFAHIRLLCDVCGPLLFVLIHWDRTVKYTSINSFCLRITEKMDNNVSLSSKKVAAGCPQGRCRMKRPNRLPLYPTPPSTDSSTGMWYMYGAHWQG